MGAGFRAPRRGSASNGARIDTYVGGRVAEGQDGCRDTPHEVAHERDPQVVAGAFSIHAHTSTAWAAAAGPHSTEFRTVVRRRPAATEPILEEYPSESDRILGGTEMKSSLSPQ